MFIHLHFSAVCDLKMCLLTAVDVIATVSWFCVITREKWFNVHIIHVEILSISVIYSVHFPSVLSFLCVTAQKHLRQTSYIILLKDVICWSMGPSLYIDNDDLMQSNFLHFYFLTSIYIYTYICIFIYIYIYIYTV